MFGTNLSRTRIKTIAHGEKQAWCSYTHFLSAKKSRNTALVDQPTCTYTQSKTNVSTFELTCLFISGIMVVFTLCFGYFCGSRHFQRERGKRLRSYACVRTRIPVTKFSLVFYSELCTSLVSSECGRRNRNSTVWFLLLSMWLKCIERRANPMGVILAV